MKITNNLMEKISLETAIEYPFNIFRDMISGNHKWREFIEIINQFHETRNELLGYALGNDQRYVVYKKDYYGEQILRFSFGIYRDKFCLWDTKSQSLISDYKIDIDEVPTEEFCEYFEDTVKHYADGFVRCSDCGSWIKKEEIAGHYFAGIYCENCWNSKWKAIEAQETYD